MLVLVFYYLGPQTFGNWEIWNHNRSLPVPDANILISTDQNVGVGLTAIVETWVEVFINTSMLKSVLEQKVKDWRIDYLYL